MDSGRREILKDQQDKIVKDLQELLVKNHDAGQGFKTAENASRNPQLKKFLKKQASQKNHFVTEIEDIVTSLNEAPRKGGSALGMAHRAWMDIKTAITRNKDEAVLQECLRGEKESEREYEKKLRDNNFPSEISEILKKQLGEIRITIAQVSSLEDLADNKALGY